MQRLARRVLMLDQPLRMKYGKTFYLQIELKTKQDEDSLAGDSDPVPFVRRLLQRA